MGTVLPNSALSAGYCRFKGGRPRIERNREWVVGDLQNNPGKSCAINLNTGLWCDPAEGQKGNAKQLWCALFGIDPRDRFAIVEGIRAWILKGELPDGSALGYRPEAVKPQPKGPQPAKNSAKEQARWLRIVEETREMGSIAAECFANERGLSVEVFEWLITQGYIGFYYSPKRT